MKNYFKYFMSLFLVFIVIFCCSACANFKGNFEIDDVVVTYEFLGADTEEDSTQFSDSNVFLYRIKVVNNSDYELENVEKTVFSLENLDESYTHCLKEGYVEIRPNDFSISVPIKNAFDYDIDEDEVLDILKNKTDDIVSFEVNGKKFECTGNCVKGITEERQ